VNAVAPQGADGLQAGDELLLPQMDASARAAAVFHYTPTQAGRAGDAIRLVVRRAGQTLQIAYPLRRDPSIFTFAAQMVFKLVLLAIALLLLWRGSDAAAMVLGAWCVAVSIALPEAWWGALPVPGRIAGGFVTALLWTVAPFLLYLVIDAVAVGVSATTRYVCRTAMVLLVFPTIIVNAIDATAQATTGCWLVSVAPWVSNAAFVASQLVIVAFFAFSYLRTHGLAKQRLRWVFWSFIFSRAGVLLNLTNRLSPHPVHLSGLEWFTVLIFPLGCTYAILRHRIINVNFVLNRTLVFTTLTTLVVGVFILIEYLLGKVAASRGIGIAIDVAVALSIGFSFNALHKYVEAAIERALFRAKHEAATSLRRLSEEAPFMENADALLHRTVNDVCAFTGASGAAVYERVDGAYRLTVHSGDPHFPEVVDVDDLAFVRLRKSGSVVWLSHLDSALGHDGVAFPLAVRGQVIGSVVCRRRSDGESYAPDEIALLTRVAHDVGSELYAIRAREQAELLDRVLAGSVEIGEARVRQRRTLS
jgi:hypothetical protein